VGGCQTGEARSFPSTEREVFGCTKILLFEFGVKSLNFGATYLSFGAIYLIFGAKIENRVFLNGVGGRVGEWTTFLGGFVSVYGKKNPPTPWKTV